MQTESVDRPAKGWKMPGMLSRAIQAAMRNVVEELIEPRFLALDRRIDELSERLGGRVDELSGRVDGLSGRVDGLSGRLDSELGEVRKAIERVHNRFEERGDRVDRRLDELAAQQGRMVEQIASLKTAFDVAAAMTHRIDRLEDRVFAKAR